MECIKRINFINFLRGVNQAHDFDYMIEPSHFEKVILKRIFEDGEAGVYSILSYEVY
jgi:hypothetical protein